MPVIDLERVKRPRRITLRVQLEHAKQLTPGTRVIVRDDSGRDHPSVVLDPPWCMGGHSYVVNCEGFRAYHVMRVRIDETRPAVAPHQEKAVGS